jgi:hypothetical protein
MGNAVWGDHEDIALKCRYKAYFYAKSRGAATADAEEFADREETRVLRFCARHPDKVSGFERPVAALMQYHKHRYLAFYKKRRISRWGDFAGRLKFDISETDMMDSLSASMPNQFNVVLAHEVMEIVDRLPKKYRDAAALIMDGASILDVADDLGWSPREAMGVVSDIRKIIANECV